jgi:predicted transcriptional regulator
VIGGAASKPGALRRYDRHSKVLSLNPRSSSATHAFQIAHQLALIAHSDAIQQIVNKAEFRSKDAEAICRIGLANYFAGAAVLPYGAFLEAAREQRHDLELLAERFGASVEQVAHRLSTLQRPGLKGVPFFFARVDQAGNITKRHSATKLQFARFGSACPLWNVHSAFETPNRIIRQLAETPDGIRYLCLATTVSKPGGGFRSPVQRYALALGCEVRHAGRARLCRRSRHRARRGLRADRHLLPDLRTKRLPPARGPAAQAPSGGRSQHAVGLGNCTASFCGARKS